MNQARRLLDLPREVWMLGWVSFFTDTASEMVGASAGTLVSALGNGTAVPLAAVIAGCAVLAFAVFHALGR